MLVYMLRAARPLTVRDGVYDRTFTVQPGVEIFDPYLLNWLQRARVPLRIVA